MKRLLLIYLWCFPLMASAGEAPDRPASPPQPDFSPPPVPGFMLKKPERPLSLEEMQKMADEAALRARPPSPQAGSTPAGKAQSALPTPAVP